MSVSSNWTLQFSILPHEQRLGAGSGLQDLIAVAGQRRTDELTHLVFVLDDEDGAPRAGRQGAGFANRNSGPARELRGGNGNSRQKDAERGARACGAFDFDPALMLFDDAVNSRRAPGRCPARWAWW